MESLSPDAGGTDASDSASVNDLSRLTAAPINPVSPLRQELWRRKIRAVLPHEWVFGAFLLLTALRLLTHAGAAREWSLVFGGCWLGGVGVFLWAERKPTVGRWRLRLLYYPAVMGISFYALGMAVPLLGIPKVDWLLLRWDRAWLGETPSVAWESWLRPWLEDLAMASYLFFFYYLVAGPAYYCLANIRLFRKCIIGLFTLYGLCFMGYTVLPAAGPHCYLVFATPLHGPLLLDRTINPINAASNAVDVFPSVHVAASLYLLMFDWRHRRRQFWWRLLPCLLLWLATLYLRFHYFVDLLAGVLAALAGWGMAQAYEAPTRHQPMLASEPPSPEA